MRYFEMGSLPKVRHRFRLLFFKRTTLLLIYHQFLQFWYQCIKNISIYRFIDNFPPNCCRNTRKTDKVYDFLKFAKCVDDLWIQTLRLISQSPRATSVRHHSLTSFGISLKMRGFQLSGFKGHPRRLTLRIEGNRRLCPFSVCSAAIGGDCRCDKWKYYWYIGTKLKKLMMNW